MNYNQDQLLEKFESLPDEVKLAMSSVETAKTIGDISAKHKLHIDQSGILAEEIGSVMLGITKPLYFVDRIATKLKIPQFVAVQITKEINEKIFNPIKESLKQVHQLDEKMEEKNTTNIFNEKIKMLFSQKKEISEVKKPNTGQINNNDPYREAVE